MFFTCYMEDSCLAENNISTKKTSSLTSNFPFSCASISNSPYYHLF